MRKIYIVMMMLVICFGLFSCKDNLSISCLEYYNEVSKDFFWGNLNKYYNDFWNSREDEDYIYRYKLENIIDKQKDYLSKIDTFKTSEIFKYDNDNLVGEKNVDNIITIYQKESDKLYVIEDGKLISFDSYNFKSHSNDMKLRILSLLELGQIYNYKYYIDSNIFTIVAERDIHINIYKGYEILTYQYIFNDNSIEEYNSMDYFTYYDRSNLKLFPCNETKKIEVKYYSISFENVTLSKVNVKDYE